MKTALNILIILAVAGFCLPAYSQNCSPSLMNLFPPTSSLKAKDVFVDNNLAYIVTEDFGLRIVDVTLPNGPATLNTTTTAIGTLSGRGVCVVGNKAYVVSQDYGLRIVDVSNPANPMTINEFNPAVATLSGQDVSVAGNLAYVATHDFGLRIVDVSNPATPVTLNPTNPPVSTLSANGLCVSGNYAYVATNDFGLRIVDVTEPANPVTLNPINPAIATLTAKDVCVVGNLAYVITTDFGIRIVDVSDPADPVTMNPTNTAIATISGRDISVCNNKAYVVSGNCLAGTPGVDCDFGLRIVDVSDPANPTTLNPVFTGTDMMTYTTTANGVFVQGNEAYVATEQFGLRIVDLKDCGCLNFVTHNLILIVQGNGKVSTSEQPPKILNCTQANGMCIAKYPAGTIVQLVATPDPGYIFNGWMGADANGEVVMDGNKYVTARFVFAASATITKSGPSLVQRNESFTYTLNYENTGATDLTNVVIEDTLPEYLSFVSASNGGTNNAGIVTWNIGTVPPGESGQVTLTVDTDCLTPYKMENKNYKLTCTEMDDVIGTVPVNTKFDTSVNQPITVDITSVPQDDQLQEGDFITHTISLTNPGPEDLACLRMTFGCGASMDFGMVIDYGGGVITEQNPSYWVWRGNVDAGTTVDVIFTTIVEDCIMTSLLALNHGIDIRVYNPDSQMIGLGTPPSFPVERSLLVEHKALNLGPIQSNPIMEGYSYQAARPGNFIDLQINIINRSSTDKPGVSISTEIPSGLAPNGNPPFISPTDPAATYTDTTKTISWAGTVKAGQTVSITYRARLNESQSCRTEISLSGGTGQCQNIDSYLSILVVPEPPTEPHLIGLDAYTGLFTWQPGLDRGFRQLFCIPAEILFGMTQTPDGDIWIAGVPAARVNPYTMDFEIFGQDFHSRINLQGVLKDVAYHPPMDKLIFLDNVSGGNDKSIIKSYDPDTGQAVKILDDLPQCDKVIVDPDGMIVTLHHQGLIQIDPNNPANYQTFMDYDVTGPSGILNTHVLALDSFGNYIIQTSEYSGMFLVREFLIAVNRTTGTFFEVVSDLGDLLRGVTGGPSFMFMASVPGPSGEIYLGPVMGNDIAQIEFTPSVTGQFIAALGSRPPKGYFNNLSDLEYIKEIINLGHFTNFAGQWGSVGPDLTADLDEDGDVDVDDLLKFIERWMKQLPDEWQLEN